MREIINNNQKWIFLSFKNNKIKYETDEEKIKLFLELRLLDKFIKTFRCKEIISKYDHNILDIKNEVLNNEELRLKLSKYNKIENNEELKDNKELKNKIIIKKEESALDIIKKQLGL